MAEKPLQDKKNASKDNPKGYDYDRDGVVDADDDAKAVMDKDQNGIVTSGEETRYQQKQQQTTTDLTYNAEGQVVSQTTTGGATPPKEKLTARKLGLSDAFLRRYPEMKKLLDRAIAEDWNEQKFNAAAERETEFAKNRTDAQEAFIIQMSGDKREDLLQKIADKAKALKGAGARLGVTLTDQQADAYARRALRNGLTDEDEMAFFATRITTDSGGAAAAYQTGLKQLASAYGVTLTEDDIKKRTQEAIRFGMSEQDWLAGQDRVFKQQAKLAYPAVADLLETNTLSDLAGNYLADAAEILGRDKAQFSLTDPLWTEMFNTQDGKPMTKQQWIAKVKTDTRYGYAETPQAKNESARNASGFLSAMGLI